MVSVKFSGHIVSKSGILMDPQKVKDFMIMLRDFNNSPRQSGVSPSDLMFGRRQKTELPALSMAFDLKVEKNSNNITTKRENENMNIKENLLYCLSTSPRSWSRLDHLHRLHNYPLKTHSRVVEAVKMPKSKEKKLHLEPLKFSIKDGKKNKYSYENFQSDLENPTLLGRIQKVDLPPNVYLTSKGILPKDEANKISGFGADAKVVTKPIMDELKSLTNQEVDELVNLPPTSDDTDGDGISGVVTENLPGCSRAIDGFGTVMNNPDDLVVSTSALEPEIIITEMNDQRKRGRPTKEEAKRREIEARNEQLRREAKAREYEEALYQANMMKTINGCRKNTNESVLFLEMKRANSLRKQMHDGKLATLANKINSDNPMRPKNFYQGQRVVIRCGNGEPYMYPGQIQCQVFQINPNNKSYSVELFEPRKAVKICDAEDIVPIAQCDDLFASNNIIFSLNTVDTEVYPEQNEPNFFKNRIFSGSRPGAPIQDLHRFDQNGKFKRISESNHNENFMGHFSVAPLMKQPAPVLNPPILPQACPLDLSRKTSRKTNDNETDTGKAGKVLQGVKLADTQL